MTITFGHATSTNSLKTTQDKSGRCTIGSYSYRTSLSSDLTAVATSIPLTHLTDVPTTSTAGSNGTLVINPDTNTSETISTWTGKGATITGATRASTAYAAYSGDIVEVNLAGLADNEVYITNVPHQKLILYINNNDTGVSLDIYTKPRVTRNTTNATWFDLLSPTYTSYTISLIDSVTQRIEVDLDKAVGDVMLDFTAAKDLVIDIGFDKLNPIESHYYE